MSAWGHAIDPCPSPGTWPCSRCKGPSDRGDLSLVEWLRHLQDELLDAAVYVEAAIALEAGCGVERVPMPRELHSRSKWLVVKFAKAMAAKLRRAEMRHGYTDQWASPENVEGMRREFWRHAEKGDPVDVANFAAFLWFHGTGTRGPGDAAAGDGEPRPSGPQVTPGAQGAAEEEAAIVEAGRGAHREAQRHADRLVALLVAQGYPEDGCGGARDIADEVIFNGDGDVGVSLAREKARRGEREERSGS